MKRIVIFASGSGSNAENIIRYFNDRDNAKVVQVLTNNRHAKVIDRCNALNVGCLSFNKAAYYTPNHILNLMQALKPDMIVLAGFLLKFPKSVIAQYPNKIINIHPALLPNYGGKGMYGMYVHKAVIANREPISGITIHYVNENYDEGAIVFQKSCELSLTETAEDVAEKIHALEMAHFPKVIEALLHG